MTQSERPQLQRDIAESKPSELETCRRELSAGADSGYDHCSYISEADCLIRLDNFRRGGHLVMMRLRLGQRQSRNMAISAAQGRISAPFGPAAGWGDVLTGILAIPVALMAATRSKNRGWVFAWNLLGAADLIDAVALGALSAPGTPFRVFTEGPGTAAMGTLPWIIVPTMLVPLYFLVHFAIATKITSEERAPRAVLSAPSAV